MKLFIICNKYYLIDGKIQKNVTFLIREDQKTLQKLQQKKGGGNQKSYNVYFKSLCFGGYKWLCSPTMLEKLYSSAMLTLQ